MFQFLSVQCHLVATSFCTVRGLAFCWIHLLSLRSIQTAFQVRRPAIESHCLAQDLLAENSQKKQGRRTEEAKQNLHPSVWHKPKLPPWRIPQSHKKGLNFVGRKMSQGGKTKMKRNWPELLHQSQKHLNRPGIPRLIHECSREKTEHLADG